MKAKKSSTNTWKSLIRKQKKKLPTTHQIVANWKRLKDKVKRTTKSRTKYYCENSSINCYQYLVDDTLKSWERGIWVLVHLAALASAAFVLTAAGQSAADSLAATSRVPEGAHISVIPHPAIALCPYNKLSLNKIEIFARDLIDNGTNDYNEKELIQLLGYMGLTYDFQLPPFNEMDVLHQILQPYQLDRLMRSLSPSCEEILLRCLWRGKIVDCMQLFTLRKTSEGYCCIFNYLREGESFLSNISTNVKDLTAMAGIERGLSIVVDPKLEDYVYTTVPNEGFKLLIFNPTDFPDVTSGGCLERAIAPSSEVYMSLDAVFLEATKEVADLPALERQCLVLADRTVFYDSYSDCVVNCRIRSARAACGCVPHFLPAATPMDVCDLTDNMCLSNWKKSWEEAWSGEEELLESGESAGAARTPPCAYCLPLCSESSYMAQQAAVDLQPWAVNNKSDTEKAPLKRGIFFKDHSVIHIFFTKDIVTFLRHDILYSWIDWLSSLGGLCGLVLGCSIISIAEIVYFILGGPAKERLYEKPSRQLYWDELRRS